MKNSYNAILFDLDGTLIKDDLKIDHEDIRLIRNLAQEDITISIATGRILKAASPFIEKLDITAPVILYNGSVLVNPVTRNEVWSEQIDSPEARSILDILRAFKLDTQVYSSPTDDGFYVEKITKPIKQFVEKDKIPAREVDSLKEVVASGAVKFLNIGEREELKRCKDRLEKRFPNLNLVLSEQNYLEVLPSGVSKGEGLKRWSNLQGIPLESIVAFGDNMNDLELL
ncbi:MAG: HAD family hydrolase, partial [Candidatus Bipolaricaulia bacterium]